MYSNNIFSLYEYAFSEPENYSSIRLIKHRDYSVEDTTITVQDIQDILRSVHLVSESENVLFSQADTFQRVINLCELLSAHNLTKQDITAEYDFNERQADYYANAGCYLGLIDKTGQARYSLSASSININNSAFSTYISQ